MGSSETDWGLAAAKGSQAFFDACYDLEHMLVRIPDTGGFQEAQAALEQARSAYKNTVEALLKGAESKQTATDVHPSATVENINKHQPGPEAA